MSMLMIDSLLPSTTGNAYSKGQSFAKKPLQPGHFASKTD
jgi:hypothetical protein